MDKIKELADLLFGSNNIIAFTGAGMSTESGILDFRSPDNGFFNKINPMDLSFPVLKDFTEDFYETFVKFVEPCKNAKPNDGHYALAELERMGLINLVVTQNIDGFHQQAGSQNVLEIHGHLRECSCMKCKKVYDYSVLDKLLTSGIRVPLSQCCNATLRPSVVLYYENLSKEFELFRKNLNQYDFALVMGTSLEVVPAAYIAQDIKNIAIINKGTTTYDYKAKLIIRDSIGETLDSLVQYLFEIGS